MTRTARQKHLRSIANSATCSKVRYQNEINVKIALARASAKDKSVRRFYRCSSCHGWHLASKP